MLEGYSQELKRRTRVVRIFPDDGSCLPPVSALVQDIRDLTLDLL
jgi:transposase-like protein